MYTASYVYSMSWDVEFYFSFLLEGHTHHEDKAIKPQPTVNMKNETKGFNILEKNTHCNALFFTYSQRSKLQSIINKFVLYFYGEGRRYLHVKAITFSHNLPCSNQNGCDKKIA